MKLRALFLSGLLSLSAGNAFASADQLQAEFIDKMVTEHNYSADALKGMLGKQSANATILEAIARPWEAKPWHQYYPIFLTDKRLQQGIAFWQTHADTLARAEQTYGVPAQIIVAIIGVETFYGTYKGKYAVLDALYTLGFHYPPRATFFRSELEQFLLLCREENWDPANPVGSYAGAMGMGQFISSSYRHYAVDFDQDGERDLINNPVDAIGSVANYFAEHGWKAGQPVAYPVSINGGDFAELLEKPLKPRHTAAQLRQAGVVLPSQTALPEPLKLLEFEQTDRNEYWVGLHNFYVITRYNHSPLYAMAVYQLSEQIKRGYQASLAQ